MGAVTGNGALSAKRSRGTSSFNVMIRDVSVRNVGASGTGERRGGEEAHGHGDPARLQLIHHRREAAELPLRVGGITPLGIVGMGTEASQAEARQLHHGCDHLHGLLRGNAEPFEADVHFHEHVTGCGGSLRVGPGAVEIHESRRETVGHGDVRRTGQRIRIDKDRRRDSPPSET